MFRWQISGYDTSNVKLSSAVGQVKYQLTGVYNYACATTNVILQFIISTQRALKVTLDIIAKRAMSIKKKKR